LVLLAGGALGAWQLWGRSGPEIAGVPAAPVTRGSLVVTVNESGEVEAEKRKIIRNELHWPVVIKSVVPDGTVVEQGDLIIEFECKELIDALRKQELTYSRASNEHIHARNNLELKREEVERKLTKARDAVADAERDYKRYVDAEWPIKLGEAETEIRIAQRNKAVAQDQLELKLRVNQDEVLKGLYSDKVIESARFEVEKQQLALDKAEDQLQMLKKFDDPRQRRRLQNAIKDAKLQLLRAELEVRNEIQKAEADLKAKKLALGAEKEQLDKLREDEMKLKRVAEEDGLVVYDTARRHWQTPIEIAVGETIDRKQQLMIIPELETLQVKTKIFEAMYNQVQEGAEATVRLDTDPDNAHPAKVTWVAPLANQQHWFNPGVKVFDVIVKFDEMPKGLKPNMTARVSIVTARLDDALSVPIAAVFTDDKATYCWKHNGGDPVKTRIEVGKSNESRVQVLAGLGEDDQVLLIPPAGGGRLFEDDEDSPDVSLPATVEASLP
jgi:multidrug efflux pump subunit AcrA (membrane-fusion protein)